MTNKEKIKVIQKEQLQFEQFLNEGSEQYKDQTQENIDWPPLCHVKDRSVSSCGYGFLDHLSQIPKVSTGFGLTRQQQEGSSGNAMQRGIQHNDNSRQPGKDSKKKRPPIHFAFLQALIRDLLNRQTV